MIFLNAYSYAMLGMNSIMQDFFDYLDKVYQNCTKDIGTVAGIGSALCAIFALFYIGNIIWHSWCQGGSINLYAIFKPFCIGLIIANFGIFTQMIDGVMSLINKPTMILVEKSNNDAGDNLANVISNIKSIDTFSDDNYNNSFQDSEKKDNSTEEESFIYSIGQGIGNSLSGFFMWLFNSAITYTVTSFVTIISLLGSIVALCVMTLGTFTKIILFYIGPFVFALSLIPYFSDSIRSWLARYITVCLYAPCINIINFGMMSVYNFFLENLSASDSLSDVGSNYASTFPIVAISIAAAFCYICVPSIAGFIINSTGAKDITHEAVSRGEGSAKQGIAKAAGAAGGGVATAVHAVSNGIKKMK
ncbi:MAG TPA: hypothetical protein PLB70_01810 [Paludibacteraceae bacterium]|nr:hypothetical protein [Paludibacteraceae bacterium]